jgi:cell division cycle 20-like protein 1 (cofactor of APC complex)
MPEIATELHISSSLTSRTVESSLTPTLVSPPHSKTPPTATGKCNQLVDQGLDGVEGAGSKPLDPNALSNRLQEMEDGGRIRERTPGASPSRKRQRIYGDRSVEHITSPLGPFPMLQLNVLFDIFLKRHMLTAAQLQVHSKS